MSEKSKVLVVGGTGYIGKRIVSASLAAGHPTYVLYRREIGLNIEKLQMLLDFKSKGARLVDGSFEDYRSLVDAVKLVDVVISCIAGVHIRAHHILLQLRLVEAIKEAGNVKRFIPSEFGIDAARMQHALEPGKVTFDDKMVVRKAIESAGIPFTYILCGCFAGYFVGGLCQIGRITPSRDEILLNGDGLVKAIFLDEDDIAKYTIETVDDPRTVNKSLYLRPPENILSQLEVIKMWEDLIGVELKKTKVTEKEVFEQMKVLEYSHQVGLGHYYQMFYEGCLTNFEIDSNGEEASALYPNVCYTRVKDYLKRYL